MSTVSVLVMVTLQKQMNTASATYTYIVTDQENASFPIPGGKENINNFHLFGADNIRHLKNSPTTILILHHLS